MTAISDLNAVISIRATRFSNKLDLLRSELIFIARGRPDESEPACDYDRKSARRFALGFALDSTSSGSDTVTMADSATGSERPARAVLPLWLLALGSGLLAGTLAAIGGEFISSAFHKEPNYPSTLNNLTSSARGVALAVVRYQTKLDVQTNTGAAAFGLLGATLGIVLAGAGGLAGRSRQILPLVMILGGIAGGIVAAALTPLLVPVVLDSSDSMVTVAPMLLLTHWAIFAAIGAIAGAGMGVAFGDRRAVVRCLIGGVIGALIGTLIADVVNIGAFGVMRAFEPVPAKSSARIVLLVVVALSTTAGATLGVAGLRSRKPS
jgi:hypothetical protein